MAKLNISTAAVSKKNRFHLPTTHLTTMALADFMPINILPLRMGDKVDVNMTEISQTNPTAVKTFGSFKLKTYAFFVPHRVVWKGYKQFRDGSVDATLENKPLTFRMIDLAEFIFGTNFSVSTPYAVLQDTDVVSFASWVSSSPVLADNWDFSTYYGGRGSIWTLTALGRRLFKMLLGLGYQIPRELYLDTPTSALSIFAMDAMPILSFARFIYDYVYPSQYVQQQGFGYLFENPDIEDVESWLPKVLKLVFVPYDQDFLTTLWLKYNSVGTGTSAANFAAPVNTPLPNEGGFTSYAIAEDGTMAINTQMDDDISTVSATSLRWLTALSDFVVRNNIGGSRFRDYMRSHFGYVTTEADTDHSVFLKSFVDNINFYPVEATTGTSTQLLGERAANGNASGSGHLKFEASEEGFLIFAAMLTPSTAYYQGIAPWCERLNSRFDLYTPELDSVDMQPIPRSRVFMSYDHRDDFDKVPYGSLQEVFGFAPRYADRYKRGYSFLSGDFRLGSRNKNAGAYHTFRDVMYNRTQLALDAQFLSADNQYERIFALNPQEGDTLASQYDKIETLFLFDVVKYSEMLSISDSLPLFNRSGRDVSLENQGNAF